MPTDGSEVLRAAIHGALGRNLPSGAAAIAPFRRALQDMDQALADAFTAGAPVGSLIRERASGVDTLLASSWARELGPDAAAELALIAVGGYGRGELHPSSDVDLMILRPAGRALPSEASAGIERFLAFLWDIGLKLGHAVRTPAECAEEAARDVTTATNLMEARRITGAAALLEEMQARTRPPTLWASNDFFTAKLIEQAERHRRFNDTAYNLEPNVKDGPGGLRDLQTVLWIAQRHFGTADPDALRRLGFLQADEHRELLHCREAIWRVRFALHLLSGRNENRLLFDHQRRLADQLGYRDEPHRLAVESFMKDYYRTIAGLTWLSDILLQLLRETIFLAGRPPIVVTIDARFQVRDGYLEATAPDLFRREPSALIEAFLLLQQRPGLQGIGTATIRLIRSNRHRIDGRFRADPRNRALFMTILREPAGVTRTLRRMNRYGILGAYIPAFGQIVGQMQYDLFHAYTVDEHTLHVVANLRRFMVPEAEAENRPSLAARMAQGLAKPEILYLAALFHDIAKGRGGDHALLGAEEAHAFAAFHGLSEGEADFVAWLVRHHLEMSSTAQHRDLGDPDVILTFARTVGNRTRLEHLYLLTVADIQATNPALWNSWKDALLGELLIATQQALGRGLENPLERREKAQRTREAARGQLAGFSAEAIDRFWQSLDEEDYFLRHSPDEVAWHTRQVLNRPASDEEPLIVVREETARGGTEVFVYARDSEVLFALCTSAIDQLGLNILSARIATTTEGFTLHTYLVLDEGGEALLGPLRVEEVTRTIRARIGATDLGAVRIARRPPSSLRHFPIPTEIRFTSDVHQRYTAVQLVAADRPGLLARVGRAFVECGIRILHARIATFGERVEDVFLVTDRDDQPIEDERRLTALQLRLTEILDEP